MTVLEGWESFYVIVGASAGALIGLQFVVITLIADSRSIKDDALASNAFSTPSVVHFSVVLLLSAILTAPWEGIGVPAMLLGLSGLAGVVYSSIVARRMRVQTAYRPEAEDWIYHVFLPIVSYTILVGSAYFTGTWMRTALFAVGASVLLLLFAGIHNAWDAVTYLVFVRRRMEQEDEGR
jgi:hypothetical protein